MEQWFVLSTEPGRELQAAELLNRVISRSLCSLCCIPRKTKVFRSGGRLHLVEDVLFPGYLFVRTERPDELSRELKRARAFPQPVGIGSRVSNGGSVSSEGSGGRLLVPVEAPDLRFLQDVCGENLQQVMGVTRLLLGRENEILEARGVLEHYLGRIRRLNLHKRFAVVEVDLFNRKQEILFGVQLEQDQAG